MGDLNKIIGVKKDEKTPITRQQVEDFIVLVSQGEKRWFNLSFIDEDMNAAPAANALMELVADAIHEGMKSMAIQERMAQAKEDSKGVNIHGSN